MRPVLARTSSAASGFRFCGMIEEPVVNLSDSRTKPHCGEVQFTISSASRDRCMAAMAAAAKRLEREVAVRNRVERIGRGPREAERARRRLPVDGEGRAGERRRARAEIRSSRVGRIGEAAPVARKHLDIGEQMMAEGDRLRGLEMGEARHHRARILQRLLGERELKRARAPPSIAPISSRT